MLQQGENGQNQVSLEDLMASGLPMPMAHSMSADSMFAGATEMGEGPSQYGAWERTVETAQLLNMETLGSFVDSASLATEDQRHLVEILLGLGEFEYNAPCNNRLAYLTLMEKERERLTMMIEAFQTGQPLRFPEPEPDDDDAQYLSAMLPHAIASERESRAAEARIARILDETSVVRAGIQADQLAGHFHDYGRLKRLYRVKDPERNFNGLKYTLAPFFIREAMNFCLVTMQDTRLDHSEALIARMMRKHPNALWQRDVQYDGDRSRRRRRRPQADAGEDEW